MKKIRLNNLKMNISGQKLTIFDPMRDVSNEEVELIAKYLYEEGFFKNKKIDVLIKHGKN
jgi:ribosome-associated translation inhibitor RaiA